MGIVFRQSIKGSIVIFAGILLGALFTWGTTVVLPKSELGGLRNLLNQGAILQLILLAGAANLVNPYLLRYKADDPRRPVLITITLALPFLLALVVTIPYLLLKEPIIARYQAGDRPFVRSYYLWLLPLSLLLSYLTLLEYYLTGQLKVAAAIFMREVLLRALFLGLTALYAFHHISLHLFITGSVLIHAVPVLMLLALARKTEGFRISTNWKLFSRAEYKDILHYAWYHLLTTATLNLIATIDALMLGPLSAAGFSDVAVYVNAQFLMSILYAPYKAMATAAFPKMAEAFLADARGVLHDLFGRAGLNMLIAGTGMWVIVMSNLHNAVAILPKGYEAIIPIAFILSIGRIVDMATGLNIELISVSQHYKFNFRLVIVLLIIVIIADRIFIPRYGIFGAAWVTTGCAVFTNLVRMVFLYRKTGLHPFSKHTAAIFLCGGLAFGLGFLLPRIHQPVLDALYRSAVLFAAFGGLLLVLQPSPDLSHYLRQVRKDKRLF